MHQGTEILVFYSDPRVASLWCVEIAPCAGNWNYVYLERETSTGIMNYIRSGQYRGEALLFAMTRRSGLDEPRMIETFWNSNPRDSTSREGGLMRASLTSKKDCIPGCKAHAEPKFQSHRSKRLFHQLYRLLRPSFAQPFLPRSQRSRLFHQP